MQEGAASQACTATVDERGRVTGWSEAAARLLGYAPAEVVGYPAARLLADDVDQSVLRDVDGRERSSAVVALRHRDGRRLERRLLARRPESDRPASGQPASGQPASGQPASDPPFGEWLVVAVDPEPVPVPPASEALVEWAFRQSPSILGVFDADLRLVRANAGMERALSLTQEEMRGWRLAELAPHRVSDQAEAGMRQAIDSGEVQHVGACIGPSGIGAEQGWPTSFAPLRDTGGSVRAVCLTAHHTPSQFLARQRMLLESLARIAATGDVRQTAQELADAAAGSLADFAAVELLQQPPRGTPQAGTPPGAVALSRIAVRSVNGGGPAAAVTAPQAVRYPAISPVAQCLAQGQAAVYEASDPALAAWARDPQAAWIRELETHTVMVVPMRATNGPLGVLLLGRQRPQPFDADDMWLAERLTSGAADAIDARHRTREHTTTMTLQRSLLPQTLPDQQALHIATRYLPASERLGVGGDWFDVIPLSGTRVAMVVGDVVGHGMRASATMGRLRTAVRTLADVDLPPDELLTHLDDLVLHLSADEGPASATEGAAGIGTTCLYAVYDPTSRHLVLARAGHPPPAVVSPDGGVRFLDVPPGPPLGLGGLPFETYETELAEGSLIALYTDGLLEIRDHDIDEALDRLFSTLARPADELETVCDRVLTSMLTHRPDDDVALLIARTRALDSDRISTWELESAPTTVAEARHLATDQLSAWQLDEAAFVTELVVSELVTNAIRYGRPPINLRLIHTGTTLICEVFDSSNTAPHLRRARLSDEGGRGLLLVGQLAQRWGTRHTATGKTVWAEQFLTPA
ncbi:SpoIIE family protein phosphatase [Streptomyces boluensis]|uniref:SpoIIE family protein phosphatase n=1 Tax=Streptomyces boluensis TaxID=1775135 RepID=A0A964UQ07_9ACTN|nr:SpoIIE family protein phosphatase [Streptomyces boluensis]NBE53298.1 SpoIIE family protein phosphatase [Streptomyces boluensis]